MKIVLKEAQTQTNPPDKATTKQPAVNGIILYDMDDQMNRNVCH